MNVRETIAELRTVAKQTRAAKRTVLKEREKLYASLQAIVALIAETDDALTEIDEIESEVADIELQRHADLDPAARKRLVRTDGSATDFVFALIGLTIGGANATMLKQSAKDMNSDFTTGAIQAALHRLVQADSIVKTNNKKGATYKLTRTGAHEWGELIRRSHVSK